MILDEHYNSYVKLDLLYYELYSILYKKYLENKKQIINISDDDLYELAKKEYLDSYRLNDKQIKEKNDDFKNNIYGLDYSKLTDLQAKIFVCIKSNIDKVSDEQLKIDTYLSDYLRCLEKICIGFEIKNIKKMNFDSKSLKFTLEEK